jgi:hypothetical protein
MKRPGLDAGGLYSDLRSIPRSLSPFASTGCKAHTAESALSPFVDVRRCHRRRTAALRLG